MHETQGRHTIRVDELTRVEGQGAFYVKVEDGRVVDSRFKIFEPPRFFEAFLVGRDAAEVPDITARICGICPVAYQMSSCHALESIFDALPDPGGAVRTLRRLFYCGEWIESHALHAFFLHLPDFMGKSSAIEIAKTHPDLVDRAIAMRRVGNEILRRLGGRAMHPVGARVGGWHRAPTPSQLEDLLPDLRKALDATREVAQWAAANLKTPEFDRPCEFVALVHPDEYAMNEGRATSTEGWSCEEKEWGDRIEERQVEHSNAYQAVLRHNGRPYFLGPIARFNLSFEKLSPAARDIAKTLGVEPPVRNPYLGFHIRIVELAHCFEEAIAIVSGYSRPASPAKPCRIRAGEGSWATEAPRGLLYHKYRVNDEGRVLEARIVPPTSQNQGMIEADLKTLVERRLDLDDHALSHACEFMIRNYDPCISCATHFLAFRIER